MNMPLNLTSPESTEFQPFPKETPKISVINGRQEIMNITCIGIDLAWLVFQSIHARQQQIEHKLCRILTQSVEDRLVATLLDLAQLFGARCTHGYSLEIFLTQQELADLVSASRSVVSTIWWQMLLPG